MLFRPALLADQRHEADLLDLLLVPGLGAGARQPDQTLVRRRRADRHHQPALDSELGAPGYRARAGPLAVAMMASNGACSGQPSVPSPVRTSTLS